LTNKPKRNFATHLLLKFLPHLKRVATLHCAILTFKNCIDRHRSTIDNL